MIDTPITSGTQPIDTAPTRPARPEPRWVVQHVGLNRHERRALAARLRQATKRARARHGC